MYASKAVDRLMRSIVQTSNAIQTNKWLAAARLIYDAVKTRRSSLGLSTKPFASWAGLELDVQQIVAGQTSSRSHSVPIANIHSRRNTEAIAFN